MRKQIINENWELEEVLDLEDLCAVLFKYGTDEAGYVEAYDFDDYKMRDAYNNLVNQYQDANVDDAAYICLVKLPNTNQVISLLNTALYNGNERVPEAIEAVNDLCNRADCETICSWNGCLTEGKKKKKVCSSITYTTGYPDLNIKHFNKCMGTDGLGIPDKNPPVVGDTLPNGPVADNSSDGASDTGNSSNGEGGAVSESLNEGFNDSIDLEYQDLEVSDNEYSHTFSSFTYAADRDEVIKALCLLTDKDEDTVDADLDNLVDKYYDDLLDHFEDQAKAAGLDEYIENQADYDDHSYDDADAWHDTSWERESLEEDKDREPVEIADMKALISGIVDDFNKKTASSSKLSLIDVHVDGTKRDELITWAAEQGEAGKEGHVTEHYNFSVTGGLNGGGEWDNYLKDLSDFTDALKEQTKWEPVVIDVYSDVADDVFTVEFNLFNPEKATTEELQEGIKKLVERNLDWDEQVAKMKACENGTRKTTTIPRMDNDKLEMNWRICKQYNLTKTLRLIENEMRNRGGRLAQLLNTKKDVSQYVRDSSWVIDDENMEADVFSGIYGQLNSSSFWGSCTFEGAIIGILAALLTKDKALSDNVKDKLLAKFDLTVDELREIIGRHISNPTIFNKLRAICQFTESLEEAAIYSHKTGEEFEIPDDIKILDQDQVEAFIKQLSPEEEFEVGYVTPIRFYKELDKLFNLVKATEMKGYTGMDYRDAVADKAAADHDIRVANAERQIATYTQGAVGHKLNKEGEKFSTSYRDTNKLALNPKKPNERIEYEYELDAQGNPIKDAHGRPVPKKDATGKDIVLNKTDMNKILFYPVVNSQPVTHYYIDFHDGSGFRKIDRNVLVQTVYKKIVEMSEGIEAAVSDTDLKWLKKQGYPSLADFYKIHNNIPVPIFRKAQELGVDPWKFWKEHPFSPRWSLDDFLKKARYYTEEDTATIMAQDAATISGKDLEAGRGMDRDVKHYEDKPQVRALYSNQVYYISGKPGTFGARLAEALEEEMKSSCYDSYVDWAKNFENDEDKQDYLDDVRNNKVLSDKERAELLSLAEDLKEGFGPLNHVELTTADGKVEKKSFQHEDEAIAFAKDQLATGNYASVKAFHFNGDDPWSDPKLDTIFDSTNLKEEVNLDEAKRYVKRYYVRPQNIFCSNKEDILKALLRVNGENCSIYSLKNLSDHDDVQELKPADIIYYYDDGILYDKNHVKVMDYDLNVKHEEERKKFADVDTAPSAQVNDEYDDRLTDADLQDKEAVANFRAINQRQLK